MGRSGSRGSLGRRGRRGRRKWLRSGRRGSILLVSGGNGCSWGFLVLFLFSWFQFEIEWVLSRLSQTQLFPKVVVYELTYRFFLLLDAGTCTLAIVMIADYPDPNSLPGGRKTGPVSDTTTYYGIWRVAKNLVDTCVTWGKVGWQPTGMDNFVSLSLPPAFESRRPS